MFRKLLLLSCLFIASHAFAQVGITPINTTAKPASTQIDYTQMGAPLPPLKFLVYRDTVNRKKDTSINSMQTSTGDAADTKKKHHKKKDQENNAAMRTGVNAEVSKDMLTNDDLDYGANLFVVMFNPTCSHCQEETIALGNNGNLFKKSKIMFVADQRQLLYMGDFIKFTHFERLPSSFYLGIDSSDIIKKLFVYKSLPQINVYDKDRKLIKTFNGEVAIDSLKGYIQ